MTSCGQRYEYLQNCITYLDRVWYQIDFQRHFAKDSSLNYNFCMLSENLRTLELAKRLFSILKPSSNWESTYYVLKL